MQKLLSSRRFWSFVIAQVATVIIYFVSKYYVSALDDVKVILGFVDGLASVILVVYTVDDIHERQTAERLEQARIRQALPTLEPPPTETTAKAQALWDAYPPVGPTGHVSGIPDHDTNEADRARART